jgi:2-polyprenyl-3-methyl-5-hydroxy-6-metoxy-1,4-benzoquinol methylase
MLTNRNTIIEKYVSSTPSSTRILDVGCADMPGVDVYMPSLLHKIVRGAADKGQKVVGLDNNKVRVDSLRQQGFDIICEDLLDFNPSEKYDLVIAGEIIEHISDQGGFFETMQRITTPKGALLISTPNPSGALSTFGYWLIGKERSGDGHVLFQSPRTVAELAMRYGFKLTQVHHCYWDYPQPWMIVALPFEIFPRMRPTLLYRFDKVQ